MSENEKPAGCGAGYFCWNELMTPNEAAARQFYSKVLGWSAKAFGPGADYTLLTKGDTNVGGMMQMPGGAAQWIPYVVVEDVDATVAKAAQAGGKICKDPFEVPTVGRIAILTDPQGATIGIIKPNPQG